MLLNLRESKSFNDFVKTRCEEVLESDEDFKKLNSEVLEIEKKLTTLLNNEQLKIFLNYEKLTSECESLIKILIYKAGLCDKQHI